VALAAALAGIAPRVAGAQSAPRIAGDLAIDPFRPALDSRGYLTVNASAPLEPGQLAFGLGALSWGRGLLLLEAGGAIYSVDHVVTATLIGALGLRVGPVDAELAASLPLSILAGARGAPVGPGEADRAGAISGQGLGNAALHGKLRLRSPRRWPFVGVAAIASAYLPTATPAARFLGEGRAVPQLVAVVDRALGSRGRLALTAGVRWRSVTAFTDLGTAAAPGTEQTIAASTELPVGVAAAWAIAPRRLELLAEVIGAVQVGEHQRYQPLEALGGIKVQLARSSHLTLGGGRGLLPGRGGNPTARALIAIVFEPSGPNRDAPDRGGLRIADREDRCPDARRGRAGIAPADDCSAGGAPDRDRDGLTDGDDGCPDEPEDRDGVDDADGCPDLDDDRDGVLDLDDLCPAAPEDRDGFDDADGCPDLDDDRDRVPDRLDRCPAEPEIYNHVDDADGCPDRGLVIEREREIVLLRPIQFDYDRDTIARASYPILDAVVAALQGNPDLRLLEIAGHTDAQGDDAYNLDLSIRRAAAVRRHLLARGVRADRLVSQGYGETQPLDRRSTAAAHAVNRRVELVILRRD
jgi:outer membrane protein OmpA-like peptidoglycan-associated protein